MATRQANLVIISSFTALLTLSGLGLMGCSPATETLDLQQSSAEQLTELELGIRDLISSPVAKDAASCKVVTLQAANCQQPKHLLYSVENTNEQVLLTLVAKYNKIIAAQTGNTDVSCAVINKPAAILRKDLCLPVEFATE
ncbi:hypothetical protein [Rheinheimera sp. MMS21-TC3]|uniref:hypothetical protein n=1 Tax=Rheinheimera sp. MMS21-TC3 TaxID=3072790 RepID=UPI0028C42E43|nr:hypothetical protein [Rheinheimera sp. MMS21-TC3]WNO59822.1 hypothetical protein RDV63_02330 [Rheinheimera sp. MMS21-TC3]